MAIRVKNRPDNIIKNITGLKLLFFFIKVNYKLVTEKKPLMISGLKMWSWAIRYQRSDLLWRLPPMKESRNSTIKIKNRIFAMEAAPAAMPKNPKIPATIAIIKKIIVQRNISLKF